MNAEDISLITAWYDRFDVFVTTNKLTPRQIYNMYG
jgi:hypothetical protein